MEFNLSFDKVLPLSISLIPLSIKSIAFVLFMLIFSKVVITEEIFSLFTTLLIDFNNEFKDTNEVLTFSNLSLNLLIHFLYFLMFLQNL